MTPGAIAVVEVVCQKNLDGTQDYWVKEVTGPRYGDSWYVSEKDLSLYQEESSETQPEIKLTHTLTIRGQKFIMTHKELRDLKNVINAVGVN